MNALLEATQLYKSYNGKQVVSGVSFEICEGEILGLLGPNGAGKSTIVGMLYGAVCPNSGNVKIMGIDALREGKRARGFLGIVPQENEVDRDFAVGDYLDSFSAYYGISKRERKARVAEVMSAFDLESHKDKNTEALSGGMRRRLMLGRALLNKPKIIFLDEPTTGLDPDARQDFWRYVLALRAKGCAVLLTTHYMDEAERLCDRLLLLKDGTVVDQGTPGELIEKFAGKEVLELRGIDELYVKLVAERFSTWYRKFGDGYIIGLPLSERDIIWDAVNEHIKGCSQSGCTSGVSMTRRTASLEDVFLIVTGIGLKDL